MLIDHGTPDASAMLMRMRSRSPSSQMPPLGTVLRDEKAIDALSKWISRDLAALVQVRRGHAAGHESFQGRLSPGERDPEQLAQLVGLGERTR